MNIKISMVHVQRKLWTGTKGHWVMSCSSNSCSSVPKQADELHVHYIKDREGGGAKETCSPHKQYKVTWGHRLGLSL